MQFVEARSLLVCMSEGAGLGILIEPSEEGEADGGVRASVQVGAGGAWGPNLGRRIRTAHAVRHDHGRMSGQIGDGDLVAWAGRWRDDDVHLREDLRKGADGQRSGTHRLDVLDRRIEAGDAEGIW